MSLGEGGDNNEGEQLLSINPGRGGENSLLGERWKNGFSSAALVIFWENGGRYPDFQFSQF